MFRVYLEPECLFVVVVVVVFFVIYFICFVAYFDVVNRLIIIPLYELCSHLPKNFLLWIKNAFYFILKVLFVLKVFELLSWLFGRVEKKA